MRNDVLKKLSQYFPHKFCIHEFSETREIDVMCVMSQYISIRPFDNSWDRDQTIRVLALRQKPELRSSHSSDRFLELHSSWAPTQKFRYGYHTP